jgi:hypothetical protein
LICDACESPRGHAGKDLVQFLENFVQQFGWPDQPIILRSGKLHRPGSVGDDAATATETKPNQKRKSKVKATELFPSKYLRAVDLKGKPRKVKIQDVSHDTFKDNGQDVTKAVLHLNDGSLMVCNKTNWGMLAAISGQDDDANWVGVEIELPRRKSRGRAARSSTAFASTRRPNKKRAGVCASALSNTNSKDRTTLMASVTKLQLPSEDEPVNEAEPISIAKPGEFSLDAFKSKRDPAVAGVETLLTALPHHNMSAAKDWVRLHADEEHYWSSELCFVSVPIKGSKHDTVHLISEDLAVAHLPSGRIMRRRLALATKPYDRFFLCHVPSTNMDNLFNQSNAAGCQQAKKLWTQMTSRKEEGVDGYKVDCARDPDAFPEPNWPKQSLEKLIVTTFAGAMITSDDHPGLLRLIGAKQSSE